MTTYKEIEKGIIEWNRERGNLTFDLNLEMKMLIEEANEYYSPGSRLTQIIARFPTISKTMARLVCKFDAILDFKFVLIGSMWKHDRNGIYHGDFTLFTESLFKFLRLDLKNELLLSGIGNYEELFNEGLKIVLDCNNKKSNIKDKDGKITKPKDFVGPEEKLRELLEKYKVK
jgi:hypothetical protein